jgi:hypothetical protein
MGTFDEKTNIRVDIDASKETLKHISINQRQLSAGGSSNRDMKNVLTIETSVISENKSKQMINV